MENHMALQLNSYVVHDYHDLTVLKRMCHQLSIPLPHVTISRFDMPLHVVPGTHRLSATSLMDVLKCNDKKQRHVVLNFIIDRVRSQQYACHILIWSMYWSISHTYNKAGFALLGWLFLQAKINFFYWMHHFRLLPSSTCLLHCLLSLLLLGRLAQPLICWMLFLLQVAQVIDVLS